MLCVGGAGANGGSGGIGGIGGDGGAGGASRFCNVLGCEFDDDLKQECEAAMDWCFSYCETSVECSVDDCPVLAIAICNKQE